MNPIPIPTIPVTISADSTGFSNSIGSPTLGDGPDVFYSFTPTQVERLAS